MGHHVFAAMDQQGDHVLIATPNVSMFFSMKEKVKARTMDCLGIFRHISISVLCVHVSY